MQRSMILLVSAVTLALAACGPVPGVGPLFGPDSGTAVLFILALIGLLAYGIKRLREGKTGEMSATSGRSRNPEPAIRILRERYAKGEISRSDYLQSLDDLVQH